MNLKSPPLYFVLLSLATAVCNAFGYTGHYIIGEAVWSLLDTDVKETLRNGPCDFMLGRSLGNLSTWADEIKRQARYRWTSRIHYYDIDNNPPAECGSLILPIVKPKLNLVNGIIASTRALKDWQAKNVTGECDEQVAFNFRMLLHILQDMHQPLHLTGRDRGGNDAHVHLRGRKHTLHALWDTTLLDWHLGEKYGQGPKTELADRMVKDLTRELAPEIAIGVCNGTDGNTFISWADQSVQENCNIVYRYDVLEEADYISMSNKTLLYAIGKAAVRSVCHIHSIFGKA